MEKQNNQPLTAPEQEQAQEVVAKVFELLEINGSFDLAVTEDGLDVMINAEDSGRIIGYHGEGLEALQLIISLIISRKIGRFVRTSVDIGDYKKNRTDYLKNLAEQVKDRALREAKEQVVSSLKAWERRVVHMYLLDDADVVTESSGEGKDRVLIVRPR